jgi:ketosteroid isomerase-like protein
MKEIESLFETYKNAVFQKDAEAYASIFDDEVRIFDMWMDWSSDGLAVWREIAKEWFGSLGSERVVVAFEGIRIQAGGELAAATAFVRFAAISEQGEELRYLENRLTWIVQKKEKGWKITHQHTSGPIDFETMKVILKR